MFPKISVIIPAYNAERFIKATLQSVLAQSLRPSEIIVVDDGSNDLTSEIAAPVSPLVRVIRQANAGQGAARHRGMLAASGDYLTFLDADDELLPSALERMVAALEESPMAVLAYCRATISAQSLPTGCSALEELNDAEGNVWDTLIQGNFIRTPGCVVIRRAALVEAGGWESSRQYQGNEDWDLWLRLAEAGPFIRLNDSLLQYRLHSGNYSKKRSSMDRSLLAVYEKHCHRHSKGDPRWTAVRLNQRKVHCLIASALLNASREAFLSGEILPGLKLLTASFSISRERWRLAYRLCLALGKQMLLAVKLGIKSKSA